MGNNAISGGFGRVLRHPQILLIGYLANFLAAGLLALLPMIGLVTPAYSSAMREAADGIDFWFLEEIFTTPITYSILHGPESPAGPPWLDQVCLLGVFLAILLPLLAWAPASLLSGGIFLAYTEDKFQWRRFFWGCGHWFVAFSLLNLTQGFLAILIFSGLLAGAIALGTALGSWVNWFSYPLIGLLALLWLAIFENTRLLAVSAGTRNIFKAFGQAFRLVLRRPCGLFLLYVFSFVLLMILHFVFRVGLIPNLPLTWWPLVFVVTQAFILLRLSVRLIRWAGLVTLATHRDDPFSTAEI